MVTVKSTKVLFSFNRNSDTKLSVHSAELCARFSLYVSVTTVTTTQTCCVCHPVDNSDTFGQHQIQKKAAEKIEQRKKGRKKKRSEREETTGHHP